MSMPLVPGPARDGRRPLVVLLGASGFLGSAVAAELARRPVRLRLVARRPSPVPAGAVAEIEVRRRDLSLPGEVTEAVEDADAVVHLVAHTGGEKSWRAAGERSEHINVGLMRELAEALRPTGPADAARAPVVLFGSTLQAGMEQAHTPGTYAAQKLAAERVLHRADAEGAVRGVVLRLTTVIGRSPLTGSPGRGVIAVTAGRALAGEPITMWHDGSVERDLLDVRDAATAFTTALEHADQLRGKHWVVGTGRRHRLDRVFGTVAALAAEHAGRPPVPVVTVDPPGYAEVCDFRTPDSDPSAFRAVTGWRPRAEPADGIAAAIAAVAGAGDSPEPEGAGKRGGGTERR
ncbi:NAD-dependent epimerase/dehydratase family protein [Streptomyces xinghaiensis]|uniref:NAD-dependent epimerase/dehydratase family protein n=1 Tax=Streptomyces xinghaiensis TaxID=1038928 RepID=UPI0037A03630